MRRNPNPQNLAVGDAVAFTGWGGEVRLMDADEHGVVVRFNRNGFPVILIERHSEEWEPRTLTDRYGCAVRIEPKSPLSQLSDPKKTLEELTALVEQCVSEALSDFDDPKDPKEEIDRE